MKLLALIFNNAKAAELFILRKDGPIDANSTLVLLQSFFPQNSCGIVELLLTRHKEKV